MNRNSFIGTLLSRHSSKREKALVIAVLACGLLVLGSLTGLVYCNLNSAVTPTKAITVAVEQKQVIPAHTVTVFSLSGKMILQAPIPVPESYELHFRINDKETEAPVEKKLFDSVSVGDMVQVSYGFGRLDGSLVPVTVSLIQGK